MKIINNKEDFMQATIKDISCVYNGKRDCCRCGCRGDYVYTSYSTIGDSEINDSLIEKRLKRAKKLLEEGADVDFGGTFVDVECGKNRTLTFYFDDVKENC
jgi:hypothetical protein